MPRRISSGKVGRSVLGDIFTQDNALQSVIDNANIVLQPNGTGIVESTSDIRTNAQTGVRFADSDSSNYVKLAGPATVVTNFTLTLPSATGTDGQLIATDASGNLSFINPSLAVADTSAADNTQYYLAMIDQTTGNESTISIRSDKMTYVPNTDVLTISSSLAANNVDIDGGAIDGITLGTNSPVTSAVITTADINGGSIDDTTIGGTTPGTGTFTTLNVTTANLGSSVDINGGNIDGTTIGASSAANGTFADLSAANITETSSIIYKENVSPIMNALESIVKLQGVTYDRKDNSRKNEAGLIAEDVAKVIPNVIAYKKGTPDGINYTKLTAYLIEAVKTLEAEISMLKGK